MTSQEYDRGFTHALGVAWDGPGAVAPSICLPPAPWTERDRWWAWRLENWIREAQEWSQSAERWRKRSLLAWLLLALTWAWVIWLGIRSG
jgi:hypothetical protein